MKISLFLVEKTGEIKTQLFFQLLSLMGIQVDAAGKSILIICSSKEVREKRENSV